MTEMIEGDSNGFEVFFNYVSNYAPGETMETICSAYSNTIKQWSGSYPLMNSDLCKHAYLTDKSFRK